MSGLPPSWLLPAPRVDLATREGRVRLLGEIAQDLLAGRAPSREAALFLGGVLAAWLELGGNLERDHLRVTPPAGSHRTPAALWASSRGGRAEEEPGTFEELDNGKDEQ